MGPNLVKNFVISTFVLLYALVSVISTIHVIDFFELSNPYWLAVTLAIGFEVGAAASLASIVILDKTNKSLVWALFIAITLMQVQGNMYYAFKNLEGYEAWVELFNLVEEEELYQKRVLSAVSGAILPLVALGFIKSLVDYIRPNNNDGSEVSERPQITPPEDEETEDNTESDKGYSTDHLKKGEYDHFVAPGPEDVPQETNIEPENSGESDEWDEEHAHDQVLNQMVAAVEEDEDEDALFKAAMQERANQNMQSLIKNKGNA